MLTQRVSALIESLGYLGFYSIFSKTEYIEIVRIQKKKCVMQNSRPYLLSYTGKNLQKKKTKTLQTNEKEKKIEMFTSPKKITWTKSKMSSLRENNPKSLSLYVRVLFFCLIFFPDRIQVNIIC